MADRERRHSGDVQAPRLSHVGTARAPQLLRNPISHIQETSAAPSVGIPIKMRPAIGWASSPVGDNGPFSCWR